MKNTFRCILAGLLAASTVFAMTACATQAEKKNETETDELDQTVAIETEFPDTIPRIYKFDGDTFNIAYGSQFKIQEEHLDECAPITDEESDIIDEAVYERNRFVEEKLGIKITSELVGSNDFGDIEPEITKLIMAGDDRYDALCVCVTAQFSLSMLDELYDLTDVISLDFTNDWWDIASIESYGLGSNSRFFASGDINYVDDYSLACVLFNKRLCADVNLEEPYELVRNGTWTMEKFHDYIITYGSDADGDGKYTLNDTYGFVSNCGVAMPITAGTGESVVMFDSDDGTPSINIGERFISVLEKAFELFYDKSNIQFLISDRKLGDSESAELFDQGKILFASGTVGRVVEKRFTMEDDFGVLPYPKYDEAQESYHSLLSLPHGTAYSIPITNPDEDKTGWILEIMGYYSTNTVYNAVIEKTVKTKAARDDDSVEMLEILFDTKWYELGLAGTDVYVMLATSALNAKNNFVSQIEKNKAKYVKNFIEVSDHYNFD